ncbi:MAG: RsmD family RNA methyltransferase [Candidatus Saccharimonadales bacterium]
MRIIAGTLRGRNFDSPHSHKTHPMSEKMRGALFNVLGDITDLTIFDAYGGSGAVAFEAVSRGAKKALITEVDVTVAKVITGNIKKLGLDEKVPISSSRYG